MNQHASPLDSAPGRHFSLTWGAGLAAFVVHGGLGFFAVTATTRPALSEAPAIALSELIELEAPAATAPPNVEEKTAKVPEMPRPTPRAAAPLENKATKTAEAPPSAAEAGQVVAAEPEMVDFGDRFVVGAGTKYAGGTTDAAGTSKAAVSGRNARGAIGGSGNGNGIGLRLTPASLDRSRAPALAEGGSWDCPFPNEADEAGIHQGLVTLRVTVSARGEVKSADVVSESGDGFGRASRRCALSKTWSPGLDRNGKPTEAVTLVRVRFHR